jgi:hypothetical protein
MTLPIKIAHHFTVKAQLIEVLQLIDLQIETLKQKSSLDYSQLNGYQARRESESSTRGVTVCNRHLISART